jgi:transposase
MWLVLAVVLTVVFAPVQETVRMAQVHLLTGPERRRRFSVEQKRALVGAAFAPGAVVSEVARRADVCTSLIYRWRRELGQARGGFSEVVVPPIVEATPGEVSAPAAVPAIEIEVSGGSRLSIPVATPPDLAAAVIAALRRR